MWASLRIIGWPLLFSGLAVAGVTGWMAQRLFSGAASPDLKTKAWVDAILFWGGFAAITGVLGSLLGFITWVLSRRPNPSKLPAAYRPCCYGAG